MTGQARGFQTHLLVEGAAEPLSASSFVSRRVTCGHWVTRAFWTTDLDRVQCSRCKSTRAYRDRRIKRIREEGERKAFAKRVRDFLVAVVGLAFLVTTTSGCAVRMLEDREPREPAPRTAAAAAIADAWVARVTRKPNDHQRLREQREAKRRARRHARED